METSFSPEAGQKIHDTTKKLRAFVVVIGHADAERAMSGER